MKKMHRNNLITLIAAASVFTLVGCGDEPEPNQPPGAPALTPAPATAPAQPPAQAAPQAPASGPAAAATPAVPAAPVAYQATLAEGIDFKKPGYPTFIADVSGVSNLETWGRWTDGKTVTFKFKDPLPKTFTLLVEAGAIGDNINKPIKFRVGPVEKECIFKGDPFTGSRVATLHFKFSGSEDTLTVTIPSPASLDPSKDPRALGLGLISMKVDTSGKY